MRRRLLGPVILASLGSWVVAAGCGAEVPAGSSGDTGSPTTSGSSSTGTSGVGAGSVGGAGGGGGVGAGGVGGTGGSGGMGTGGCTPSSEVCDGADNDCNGLIDDGMADLTCGIGPCQNTAPACENGMPVTCVPLNPAPAEQCNGIDDNCDGQVDDGCACAQGAMQSCYTGLSQHVGVGSCKAGMQTCVGGAWGACQGEVLPSPEVCDGIDNDCDAQTDEGLPLLACGVGECMSAGPSCVDGTPQSCVSGAPSQESCDGLDNDCNGLVDDNNPGGGQPCVTNLPGTCSEGVTSCQGAQVICTKDIQPEVCNGIDDDCNGTIDDMLDNDPSNCGACGNVCASINGTGTCANGQCTLACYLEYGNCDNNASNGCEVELSSPTNCGACGTVCPTGKCGLYLAESMATQPVDWQFNGQAYWDSATGSAVLTPNQGTSMGSVFYKNAIQADSVTVRFGFRIGSGTGADGIAFAMQSNGPTALGANGGGLSLAGLNGWALEFDTYNNNTCGDTNANHIGINLLQTCGGSLGLMTPLSTANVSFPLRNTGWHTARIEIVSGSASVSIDGVPIIENVQIPGFSGGNYYYGFGAATGALTDRHEIKDMLITFPSRRCF